jgi:periplasmic divalent cation tolerance protein
MSEFVVVLTTLPAAFDAVALGRELVESRLAACVNVLPAMQSVYRWQGAVQVDAEQQLVVKTAAAQVGALWTALRTRHPYETPEFLVLPILDGSTGYLAWVKENTGQERSRIKSEL